MAETNITTVEEWRIIPNFPLYEVSNLGRVLSRQKSKAKFLKAIPDTDGYLKVNLCHNGKRKTRLIHQLVLEAFIGPRPDGMEGCHRNGVRHDNRTGNLRWDTHAANNQDQIEHGTRSIKPGWQDWHTSKGKLNVAQIQEIKAKRANHVSLRNLAKEYNVGRESIKRVLTL